MAIHRVGVTAGALGVLLAAPAVSSAIAPPPATDNVATPVPSQDCGRALDMPPPAPIAAPAVLAAGLSVTDVTTTRTRVYVLAGSQVHVYDRPTGRQVTQWETGAPNPRGMAVDPAGNVYTPRYPWAVDKHDETGRLLWSKALQQPVDDFAPHPSRDGWRVALTLRGQAGTTLLDAAGTTVGTSPVSGSLAQPGADGGLVTVDGRYVHRWAADGTEILRVGDSHVANDPMPTSAPLHFYQQGGAALTTDGTLLVADAQRGIEAVNPDGTVRGVVPDGALGGLTQRSPLTVDDSGEVWFATGPRFTGNQRVVHEPVSALLAAVQPLDVLSHFGNRLGFGAGLISSASEGYTAPGNAAPTVTATFDPWWQHEAGAFRLQTTVRTWREVLAGGPGTVRVGRLDAAALQAGVGVSVPATPGPVDVDARLLRDDGTTAGSTCLHLTNGAAGDTLDLASLPAGADYGGPAPARDAALQDVLGTGLTRVGLDWGRLLPTGATSSTPIDFSSVDAAVTAGAAEAARRGVQLEVQLGQGGSERALVDSGQWGTRVGQVVAHLKDRVHAWEAWNEPNDTYGSPSSYVANVLAPAFRAVRAADPTAKVVGGTVCGMDLGYWQGIVTAGGLDDLDVAAIHPYGGHNRGFEEQGTPAALIALRAAFAARGRGDLPIWDTESSWWSDGSYNWLTQADKSVHARLWFAATGVSAWSYFLTEAGWGNDGVTFSAIQVGDEVKPAALALMQARTELRGRTYLGMVDTGAPRTWAMRFGPAVGGGGDLVAVFTDELATDLAAESSVAGTVVDQYGVRAPLPTGPSALAATSAVTWLELPAGGSVTLAPAESWGADLLLGGTATASSSAPGQPASLAVDGDATARSGGDWRGTPAWGSAVGDATPTLTVQLAQPAVLDRLLVSTHSLGSVVTGLRDYDLLVRPDTAAPWTTVVRVRGQFFDRNRVVAIPPQRVAQVRLTSLAINWSGYAGGDKPHFWPTDRGAMADQGSVWYGPAIVDELSGYAPGTSDALPGTTTAPAPTTPTAPPAPGLAQPPASGAPAMPVAPALPGAAPTGAVPAPAAAIPVPGLPGPMASVGAAQPTAAIRLLDARSWIRPVLTKHRKAAPAARKAPTKRRRSHASAPPASRMRMWPE